MMVFQILLCEFKEQKDHGYLRKNKIDLLFGQEEDIAEALH